jgi:pimeloyl-ACP methyl ester carboxylesterase
MVTHRGARLVTEALPETTYELLEGVGHCPQVEAADRVASLLTTFADSPSAEAA